MKKLLLVFVLCSTLTLSAQDLAKLYQEINSSVVVINAEGVDAEAQQSEFTLQPQSSQGSGVLVSNTGLIWTAAHVVQSAETVSVEFVDGDIYEAEVILSNPAADIAAIQIKSNFLLKNKKVVTIGDSDKVMIGEDVFVLGAPHGFKQSLSRGILSGRHFPENLSNDFEKVEFLQTDAAVNPGNSGGPMFNMKGEVIGIASRIFTTSGGFDGIGFAISSNVTKKLLSEATNLWTGMQTLLLTGDLARALNLPTESGLLILSVSSKGAGGKLGLKGGYIPATIAGIDILIGGDVILEIAGIKFEDENSRTKIKKKLETFEKGNQVPITILRGGTVATAQFPKQ